MTWVLRLMRSFRRQDGISLVMAVGILGVLSVSGTTVIYYSNSNARSAEFSKQNASAYDLAEAGINEMVSVLSKPENNALKPTLLPTTITTYENGTVTWSGTLNHSTQTWSLTSTGRIKNPTAATNDVTRTLTAKVPVVPTVTQPLNNPAWDYMFSTRTGNTCDQTLNNNVGGASRFYVMGNLCLSNNSNLAPSNLVVGGNLKLDNNTSIGSSDTRVETYVGKDCVYGTSSTPNNVTGACGGYSDATLTTSKMIWAKYLNPSSQYVNGVGAAVPALAIPAADFGEWYTNAMPGPTQACTAVSGAPPQFDNNGVRDNSLATQNLTPASSYTCRVGPAATTDSTTLSGSITASSTTLTVASATGFPTVGTFTIKIDNEYMVVTAGAGTSTWTVTRAHQGTTAATHSSGAVVTHIDPATGEISWNATTKVLTVNGTIYIDGSAQISNGALNQYNGQAAIYLSGSLSFNGKLCGGTSGSDCDFDAWNPNTEMLTFVTERAGQGGVSASNGIQFANNSSFQGALYAHNGDVFFGNNSKSDGPIVASQIVLSNNVTTSSFPNIVTVPVGMPGNPAVFAQPNPPQLYSG
jgi:type II secretory pathway pseudopilin PulG